MTSRRNIFRNAALLAGSLAAPSVARAQAPVRLRVGNVYPATHSIPVATERFKQLAEQRSGGRLAVQVFNNSELGSEREMAEMTRQGSLEMVLSGLPGTGAYAPEIEVMEAFYVYRNIEDLARISAAIFDDLQGFIQPKGFHLVGVMYQGPRNTLSVRPLRTLADFRGLRLRIPNTPLFVGLARAWGATPTAIALAEVYTSLESGVIAALEGTHETMVTSNFHERAKFLLTTRHNHYPQPIVVNKAWFDRLPKELQDAITSAARDAGAYQLTLHKAADDQALATMRAAGVTITELTDAEIQPFRAPLIEMNRQHFANRGPRVVEVYEKMLRLGQA
jgi:tripartite ATP-independent transporter DctP family solute receptor